MRNPTKLYLAALVLVLAACIDIARPDAQKARVTLPEVHEAGISHVAQAVSHAMASVAVRKDILKAMRASSQVEHQLILTEYLASPHGANLLERTAEVFGSPALRLQARIGEFDELAELVISAPFREHRMAWRGNANIGVAGTWDSDAQDLIVFATDGSKRRVTQLETFKEYDVFFLIRPRESWGTRIGRQADAQGLVIQEPEDGEIAVVSIYQMEGREPVVVDHGQYESEEALREALAQAESTCGECSPAGQILPHPHPGYLANARPTVLRNLRMTTRTEWSSEEVETTIWYVNRDGEKVQKTTRKTGVTSGWFGSDLSLTAHYFSPKRYGATFYIKAIETDFGFDDDLGQRTYDYRHGPVATLPMWKLEVKLSW